MRVHLKLAPLILHALSAFALGGTEMDEYKVKALFLYNIAQFIHWPAESFKDPNAPILICILEPNPFEDTLDRIVENKIVGGRPLHVRRLSEVKQAAGCQMLFVPSGSPKRARALLSDVQSTGLLIVGEAPGFASDGGAINFKLKDGSVHLEINVGAAERERLQISAKLLSLAEIVK